MSKYKERRRETENRLKDTRENLTRVDDILRELNANLEKLEKQAEVAQTYRALQEQGTLKQHQFWFLKHRDAADEEQRVHAALLEAINALEARVAELRHVEAEMETVRQAHYAGGDALHQRQGELAEAALEVSRLEERIRYVVEGRERAQTRLRELQAQNEQWAARQAEAHAELERIAAAMRRPRNSRELQAAQAEEQAQQLPGLEDALREAQQRSNQQRGAVAEVQQQIQVLAAESRSVDDQMRQLQQRSERLGSERQGLALPDLQKLEQLQRDSAALQRRPGAGRGAAARAGRAGADAGRAASRAGADGRAPKPRARPSWARGSRRCARCRTRCRAAASSSPGWSSTGWTACRACGRKVHIEPGWETALEAALRERLNALEVGRLETVRAFAADAPPTRLAFYSSNAGAIASTHRTLPRLSELLRLNDAGLQALLNDWLEGVYTAPSLDEALAARGQLTHGEVIMSREGHAVSQYAVSFYAPDSEQAGMLARQQEIENLERQHRAQGLIADEARSASVRVEAAYTEASLRLATARREAAEAQTRAHQTQVELLRLSQQAEASQARRSQLDGELAELGAQLDELRERRSLGEARFEELDQQLADAQQRHSELDDAVIDAERRLNAAREQLRTLERQAQEAAFQSRTLVARQGELQRAIETAQQQVATNVQAAAQIDEELAGLNDAAAQAGLQTALALRLQREQALAATRSQYDELSAKLRAAEEQRLTLERSLEPMREGLTRLQLEQQAAMLGGAQYLEQLTAAQVDLQVLAAGHRTRRRQAVGAAGRDRPAQPRAGGARRGEPGGAGGADARRANARASSTRRTPTCWRR